MEGSIFLWNSWVLFIVLVCFLHKKLSSSIRNHLLIVIILSPFFMHYKLLELNLAVIYLIILTCFYIGKLPIKGMINLLIISLIIGLGQSCYYLFSILEPLWFSWLPSWVNSILVVYLVIQLQKDNTCRMLTLNMGMVISDVLLAIVHSESWVPFSLFSLKFLDSLALTSMMLVIILIMEDIVKFRVPVSNIQKKEV